LFQLAATPPQPRSPRDYTEELRGRTVVVFGGSYGIGGKLVELARSYGADVFAFSRSETGTHVERTEDIHAALAQVYQETGRIDHIVVTAGVLRVGTLADFDDQAIEESFRVNYLAPVQIARVAVDYLRATEGSLLLYTSSSYTRGRARYSLYSSAKAAIVNLTQALSDEWSDLGIRINCINPERTSTPMRTRAFGAEPPESLLTADAVAATSLDVLISDLTGHVIDVRRLDPIAGDGSEIGPQSVVTALGEVWEARRGAQSTPPGS
jgi:NAD(P)-dependent dehydrogenase (short-subunit alcohol dehydrogenase family)